MRGLTNEEAHSLEQALGPEVRTYHDDPNWAHVVEIDQRLHRRGLFSRHMETDEYGEEWECFDVTPLGMLALRIHRALALIA